jgi:diaminopimelate decarboxylase
MALSWPLDNCDGFLFIDGVSSLELARLYGTPLYIYSENMIRRRYRELRKALNLYYPRSRILYAAKANTSLSVLKILREEGAELDAVSPGEVYLALEAGYKPEQILFTGTSVGYEELLFLLEKGVRINLDSESQLDRLIGIEVPEMISVRVNPEIGAGHHDHVITAGPDAKFGLWDIDVVKVFMKAKQAGVKRFGIQMHIGSGVLNVEQYLRAVKRLIEVSKHAHDEAGVNFDFIDFGGGIGIPYRPEEKAVDVDIFIRRLLDYAKEQLHTHNLGEPEIWLEPGRYLVAEAGVLLTRVTTLKKTPHRSFLGVDAGFNTLVRPAMYGSYHPILSASSLNTPPVKYDVYGPLCESGDMFAIDRSLPRVSEGALLAILNAGAYGFSMSSQYNSRLRPAEVIVKDGFTRLVREKESLQDLLKGQS